MRPWAGVGGRTAVYQITDGTLLWSGGPDNRFVYSEAFAPDESLLAIGRTDGINVLRAAPGIGIPFGEPEGAVFGVTFAPDGKSLASANADHHASLWRVPEGTPIRDYVGHSNAVKSVDFSPDGTLLATASADGTARLWNVTNGEVVRIIEGGGGAAKFSADGKLLFTLNNGTFKLWHVANGAPAGSITNTGALVFDLAKNGRYFAYGTGAGTVVLARMPTVLTRPEQRGNEFNFDWQGGTGLYQVQQTTSVTAAVWANLGLPTTNTSLAVPMTNPAAFFRVQSLTNAP